MRKVFIIGSVISVLVVLALASLWAPALVLFAIVLPCIILGLQDMYQSEHSLRRNFPLVSRGRWFLEALRPYLRQYLFESETDGMPVNRMFRSVVYQRAKGARDTVPFGTKVDTYRDGYEWIAHSLGALDLSASQEHPRVRFGGPDCTQPYDSSLLNVSAMSFGSLSGNAIRALNKGAKIGGFAHNTGEGGLSPFHLEYRGDIVWQIGTGYFGCRTPGGTFDEARFADSAQQPSVKMIEIKLSQGAKPGHGGILPAIKNTPEIAAIRGVEVATTVASPPAHSAFSNPFELMHFIARLRTASGGKPIGVKLCVGRESEVVALCLAMVQTGIKPDFITVDGGEGGTGASPLEFTNSIGMPLRDGLAFVCDSLSGFDLKKEVRVIASGKIITAFHMAKNLALGADTCNSARAMMLALGCVQSLICNTNHCPTGVATQDPALEKGLVVGDKAQRVARFQHESVKMLMEIIGAAGLRNPHELNRTHIYRRISPLEIRRYDELFAYADVGSLLREPWPARFQQQMAEADPGTFLPKSYIALHGEDLKPVDMVASA